MLEYGKPKICKAAIDTIQSLLVEDGHELKGGQGNRHHGPLPLSYRPELDETPMCDEELASLGKSSESSDGPLNWAVLIF